MRQQPQHPRRRAAALAAVARLLADDAWTRLDGTPECERDLAAYHGPGITGTTPEVWQVSSGTAALEAILLGHGIGPGDHVVTTPYTWGATVSAILAVGAAPIFADVDPLTGLIRPEAVAAAITPATRAILCVHLFGNPADVIALRALADQRGVLLFEDGSQAHGARLGGRPVGAYGHASAFSTMGLKLLAGTEGGYAVFHDPRAAEAAYLYGKHPRGLRPDRAAALAEAGLLDALQLGWRPCVVSSALVRANLPYLDEENNARRRNLAWLRQHLATALAAVGVPDAVVIPPETPGGQAVWHLLSLVVHHERIAGGLAAFQERLAAAGAGCFRYIPVPIHRLRRLRPNGYPTDAPRVFWHDALRRSGVDYDAVSCPGADWRADHELTLGFNWTEDDEPAMRELADCLAGAAAAG
jgi:dTDP-4-amino-4,6-dideoxygalactose transaminase